MDTSNPRADGALITIQETNGELYADSRDIAAGLGIEHDNFIGTVDTHKQLIESEFGIILFQTGKSDSGRGRHQRYALLNEGQASYIGTLSRNSPTVLRFKAALVKAFLAARRALENGSHADGVHRGFEIIQRNHPSFALPAVSEEQYLELLEVHQEAVIRDHTVDDSGSLRDKDCYQSGLNPGPRKTCPQKPDTQALALGFRLTR